ncbi:hypothetical protein BUALT_Bualt02G0180500 [Buddleja alternifolia]|uniref:Saccharopine dehydrogenase NADP binding domain-containing protein n=1 Tax=Buddleja alternifolia TaxID=168488 RepID=A0AAV6Y8B2_9LAMI|nr:hypothetical protein BUALT_Bualt02G0180500 [Buddleja alternifolia]
MARFCMQMHSGMSRNVAIANLSKESSNNEGKNKRNNVERVELVTEKKMKMKSSSRVLILGGTGRVGSSTAIALSKFCPHLRIVIAGRNRDKGAEMVSKIGNNSQFSRVDFNDTKSLEEALKDVDLVVHTAGSFQHADKCTVLEAAIQNKTAYLDVCDDTSYAWRAKSYMKKAVDANIPAITTGGICPGVSNVMAAELVRAATSESKGEPQRLRFYYYIAGSGGSRTILSSSFLILGEDVVAYNKGEKIKLKPYSGMLNIDFGQGIGKQDVFLLNLPEVRSVHEVLGVPTVSARFGTAPSFWNWGMENITNLLPPETLRDRSKVEEVVNLLYPLVRAFDGLAGEKVSMRVWLLAYVLLSGGLGHQWEIQQLHLSRPFLREALSLEFGFQKSPKVLQLRQGKLFSTVLRKEHSISS